MAGAVKEVEGKVQAEVVGERHARGSVEQHRPGRRARAHLAPPEQLDYQREAGEDAEPLHHEHDEALRPGGGVSETSTARRWLGGAREPAVAGWRGGSEARAGTRALLA